MDSGQGRYEDIVLGYNNIDSYINNPGERFLGAVVGPMSGLTFGANLEQINENSPPSYLEGLLTCSGRESNYM